MIDYSRLARGKRRKEPMPGDLRAPSLASDAPIELPKGPLHVFGLRRSAVEVVHGRDADDRRLGALPLRRGLHAFVAMSDDQLRQPARTRNDSAESEARHSETVQEVNPTQVEPRKRWTFPEDGTEQSSRPPAFFKNAPAVPPSLRTASLAAPGRRRGALGRRRAGSFAH
jgi:hypothetical protein